MALVRKLLAFLRDAWRGMRCRSCQRMVDAAVARGDWAAARHWQRKIEHIAGWDD